MPLIQDQLWASDAALKEQTALAQDLSSQKSAWDLLVASLRERAEVVEAQLREGWIPLPHAEGGTKDLPAMWHRAQCYVCQNYFGPEGGYVPGTCQHPIHISCMLRMLHKGTKCGICRAPFHSLLWFQFSLEDKMTAAKWTLNVRFLNQRLPSHSQTNGERRKALLVPFMKDCLLTYQHLHNDGSPMAEKRAVVDRFRIETRR
ncbi:hypothetical protein R1sor_013314 [Riccia sorocarpa]|uniref:RING-type domain-containing protein n=1 Tax=Riccia sorocarpa TaxID=122646 RepID=A0ABD3H9R6_9MARC